MTSFSYTHTLIREFIDIVFSVPPNEKEFRNFLAFRKGLAKVV